MNRNARNPLGNTRLRLAVFILCGTAALGLYAFSSSTTGAHAQTQPAAQPPAATPPAATPPAATPSTAAPSTAQQHPELPAGPGKNTVINVCTKCHSTDNIIANRQNRAGWENTISTMVGYGAQGSDDDFTAILEYLVKNFGPANAAPVNINKATAQEISTTLGFTAAEAAAIVQYRTQNGDFKSSDDLKKVPTLDPQKVDAVKARLAF